MYREESKSAKNAKEGRVLSDALEALSYEVIGAAIEVHQELGPGFLESVYEEAMEMELNRRKIPFERQLMVKLWFKGEAMKKKHRLDFFIDRQLVLELKTVAEIEPLFKRTVNSYLNATQTDLGLIINFNVTLLRDGIARVIRPLP